MKFMHLVAIVSLFVLPATPSVASVTYQFSFVREEVGINFELTTPDFIKKDQTFTDVEAKCDVSFEPCQSVEFNPANGGSDVLTIESGFPPDDLDYASWTYDLGTFGKTGTFESALVGDSVGVLKITSDGVPGVPLPASALVSSRAAIAGAASVDYRQKASERCGQSAAAPSLFGAGLVAFGAIGTGLKRKKLSAAA